MPLGCSRPHSTNTDANTNTDVQQGVWRRLGRRIKTKHAIPGPAGLSASSLLSFFLPRKRGFSYFLLALCPVPSPQAKLPSPLFPRAPLLLQRCHRFGGGINKPNLFMNKLRRNTRFLGLPVSLHPPFSLFSCPGNVGFLIFCSPCVQYRAHRPSCPRPCFRELPFCCSGAIDSEGA